MNRPHRIVASIEASRLISLGGKWDLTPLFWVDFWCFLSVPPHEMRSEMKESILLWFHLISHLALVHSQQLWLGRSRDFNNCFERLRKKDSRGSVNIHGPFAKFGWDAVWFPDRHIRSGVS